MSERTIVMAERRMEPALAEVVKEACLLTSMECHPWNGLDRLGGLAGRAAVVVGVLPAGDRQIPGDLAGLVTDQLPGLPLVLVAEEPLVRPLITLQGGLLTLLEPPLSATRLASCMRALLAETAPAGRDPTEWWSVFANGRHPAGPDTLVRREYRFGPCWVGVLDCAGPAAASHPTPWLRARGGLTALLVRGEARPSAGPLASALSSESLADPSGDETAAGTLQGADATIHFHSGGDGPEWVFQGGRPDETLGLLSAVRLPHWTSLSPAARDGDGAGQRQRLPAAEGDMVIALGPTSDWASFAINHFEPEEGGPALLDAFEAQLRHTPAPFTCLVLELR